ncbi:MAG: transposase [Candidatus Melainabacteria bacterium]|nr:transposase [Candidatus Melainabacteria bacterium]
MARNNLSFYNGYYQAFCYAPLFIFDQSGFPLCALLRPGNFWKILALLTLYQPLGMRVMHIMQRAPFFSVNVNLVNLVTKVRR